MHCPSCHQENREGAKFCSKCGAKLELTCPSCGSRNRPDSSFCDECGSPLIGPAPRIPAPADPSAKLRRHLPTGLAEKILAQRDRIEGERRQVTLLQKALEADAKYCTHCGTAQDYVLYSELYKKQVGLPRARESLGKAIEKFTECGADGWVTRTEERLAKL